MAATTSICLFLNSPNIPPFLISLLCNMTASEPNSFLICCIASGIDFAKYFFIFMLHSPPQHFAPVHLDPIDYKTKRQLEVNFFPTVALHTSELSANIKRQVVHSVKKPFLLLFLCFFCVFYFLLLMLYYVLYIFLFLFFECINYYILSFG